MSLRCLAIYGLTAVALLTAPRLCRGQVFISTVAGSGTNAFGGDGGPATSGWLQAPSGVAVDSAGNLYIVDAGNFRIRKVNTAGIISTAAGNGTLLFSGDGGPATNAGIHPQGLSAGVAADNSGNLYFADSGNLRIRKVDSAGIITTAVGNGQLIFGGDGGPATSASLFRPAGIAFDSAGNLYIADTSHVRVRKVDTSGIITTVAGSGALGFSGDGGPATGAAFNAPNAVAVDGAGNLFIADQTANRVRKVNTSGIITTVAGNGTFGFAGDGGPATNAQLLGIEGIAADSAGNLYIADRSNNRIRKVDTAGIITTVAGGRPGFSGDGGAATSAGLSLPSGVAVDAAGNLYIADTVNHRIRKVSAAPPVTAILASPSSLSFAFNIGGTPPAGQGVSVSSSGAALNYTTSTSTSSGGGWLAVFPPSETTPSILTVSASPARLAAGVYDGTVTLTPSGVGNTPQGILVTMTINPAVPPPGAPTLFAGGVVQGASFARAPAPVAAGSIVAIFGSGLATGSAGAATVPLPVTLAGAQVLMNGRAAPLFAVSPGQINAQVPWELRGNTTINIRVVANGSPSNTVVTNLAAAAPGIFTTAASGSGAGVVTHAADGTLITASRPAARAEFLTIFCTGLGQVSNQPPAGSAGPSGPLAVSVAPPTATIGGLPATVIFSGLAPGFVGLYQVNLQVPANAPSGDGVALVLTVGGQQSNTVTLAIQ